MELFFIVYILGVYLMASRSLLLYLMFYQLHVRRCFDVIICQLFVSGCSGGISCASHPFLDSSGIKNILLITSFGLLNYCMMLQGFL